MIQNGKHLQVDGIKELLNIRREMNDGGKRKYSEAQILQSLQKSSETIRQISNNIENDIVRSSEKSEVIVVKSDEPD